MEEVCKTNFVEGSERQLTAKEPSMMNKSYNFKVAADDIY